MKISVELDVFSGRPNPKWELDKEEGKRLNSMLQNLPALPATVPADGLGYRGFIVTLNDGETLQTVHVYAGSVWAETNSGKVFKDENHAEQLLLQMANEKGYGDILKSLGVE